VSRDEVGRLFPRNEVKYRRQFERLHAGAGVVAH